MLSVLTIQKCRQRGRVVKSAAINGEDDRHGEVKIYSRQSLGSLGNKFLSAWRFKK